MPHAPLEGIDPQHLRAESARSGGEPALLRECAADEQGTSPFSQDTSPRPSSGQAAGGVSAFVMTLNEEQLLPACLDALAWSDDVVVLDSFSTDQTTEIAAARPNVRVVQRRFSDFGDQRRFGLNAISYRNPWVLIVDADEIVGPELADEVLRAVRSRDAEHRDVYFVRRLPWFCGRPLRHNLTATFWIPRLVRPDCVEVSGLVHEQIRGHAATGRLQGYLEHHQFAKGVDDWFVRRRKYARLEEAERRRNRTRPSLADFFSPDRLRRRSAIKRVFQALPARWLIYIVYNLVIHSTWRDGRLGVQYVMLEAASQRRAVAQRGKTQC